MQSRWGCEPDLRMPGLQQIIPVLLPQFFLEVDPRTPLQFLPMAFVLGVNDERRGLPFQPDVRHQRFLRTQIWRFPIDGMNRLPLPSYAHLTTGSLRHNAEYGLDPG